MVQQLETGVYCWLNKINGKRYVGSASRSFKKRKGDHLKQLRYNKHFNRYLQKSFNKYGESSFAFEILIRCPPNRCIQWEQFFINKFQSCKKESGYNICPIAGSQLGLKHTEESKIKNRENRLKYYINKAITYKGKTQSGSQWAKELGIKKGTIHRRLQLGYPPEKILCTNTINNGEVVRTSKLTEDEVVKIRALHDICSITFTNERLAILFNVTKSTISKVILRKTWTHV